MHGKIVHGGHSDIFEGQNTVKSTVDRLTSFRAQLSRANETFAVSLNNNDVSRTGDEFIYFLKKKFCTLFLLISIFVREPLSRTSCYRRHLIK